MLRRSRCTPPFFSDLTTAGNVLLNYLYWFGVHWISPLPSPNGSAKPWDDTHGYYVDLRPKLKIVSNFSRSRERSHVPALESNIQGPSRPVSCHAEAVTPQNSAALRGNSLNTCG